MALVLYGHPFSSYTQKVLVALYENDTPFEFRLIGPEAPQHVEEWQRRAGPFAGFRYCWMAGPTWSSRVSSSSTCSSRTGAGVLFARRTQGGAGGALSRPLLRPARAQHAVDGALTGAPSKRQEGLERSTMLLERAHGWLEGQLAGSTWAAGKDLTLADCAAAPSLFYSDWGHPIADRYPLIRAYRSRLLSRPSFARAVDEAERYRPLFPLGTPDRD